MQGEFPLDAIQAMINRLEDKVEDRFNKVDNRLEKLDEQLDAVSRLTDKNTIVLEEHQRRALANEKHAHLLEQKLEIQRKEYSDNLKIHEDESVKRAKHLEAKQEELAESVELFIKLPKYLYKVAIWLAAISAGGGALYAIFKFIRFALSYAG